MKNLFKHNDVIIMCAKPQKGGMCEISGITKKKLEDGLTFYGTPYFNLLDVVFKMITVDYTTSKGVHPKDRPRPVAFRMQAKKIGDYMKQRDGERIFIPISNN